MRGVCTYSQKSKRVRRIIIDHVDIRVSDLAASRKFYEAVLAPLGIGVVNERDDEIDFGTSGLDEFGIHCGGAASSGVHVAFLASSRREVDDFHGAARRIGAQIDAPPGIHAEYNDAYYAAFVLDPDGNVIEAVCERT